MPARQVRLVEIRRHPARPYSAIRKNFQKVYHRRAAARFDAADNKLYNNFTAAAAGAGPDGAPTSVGRITENNPRGTLLCPG